MTAKSNGKYPNNVSFAQNKATESCCDKRTVVLKRGLELFSFLLSISGFFIRDEAGHYSHLQKLPNDIEIYIIDPNGSHSLVGGVEAGIGGQAAEICRLQQSG